MRWGSRCGAPATSMRSCWAILLIKPKALSAAELDGMVRSGRFGQVADWLGSYVIKHHPDKEALREAWLQDPDPWAGRAGWGLTAERVAKDPDGLDVRALLDRIEAEMATAAAPVQWTMNSCLAAIGIHCPEERARAIAIGEDIGRVSRLSGVEGVHVAVCADLDRGDGAEGRMMPPPHCRALDSRPAGSQTTDPFQALRQRRAQRQIAWIAVRLAHPVAYIGIGNARVRVGIAKRAAGARRSK